MSAIFVDQSHWTFPGLAQEILAKVVEVFLVIWTVISGKIDIDPEHPACHKHLTDTLIRIDCPLMIGCGSGTSRRCGGSIIQ